MRGTEFSDSCLLRLHFPGYSGDETFEPIPWDEWFRVFDKNQLAFVYEDKKASGEPSTFNKLVSRESVEAEA